MRNNKEQKIFLAVLWFFLIGSISFFILLLAAGRVSLPVHVWVMLLLLDVGFIIFIFVPLAGRKTAGSAELREDRGKWYPQTLAEIVDDGGKGKVRKRLVHPLVQSVSPVPLVPLILLFVVIVLFAQSRTEEKGWSESESAEVGKVYKDAEADMDRLESLAGGLGRSVSELVDLSGTRYTTPALRASLIRKLDSLASSADIEWTPFKEVGIQVYSAWEERIAWGGRPRYLELPLRESPRVFMNARGKLQSGVEKSSNGSGSRIFTSRTSLYTLLVHDMPLRGGGRVVVDVPLEVNYRINNRFLRSTSFGEVLSAKYGEEVDFNFSMGEHRGEIQWEDKSLRDAGVRIVVNPNTGVQAYGLVTTSVGMPLARLRVLGKSFATVHREKEERRALWAGLLLTLVVAVIALWVYRNYGKRYGKGAARFQSFMRRLLVFVGFVLILRFLLLLLRLPGGFTGSAMFDPALFADDFPGGLMRTTGDFLVTAVFALVLVFGTIKVFRTYYIGHLERTLEKDASFDWKPFAVKGILLFVLIASAMEVVSGLISRVVVNANPRLVGLDIGFFEMPVLSLHMALLFMVSAVFMCVLFFSRLLLVWGGGRVKEGIASLALAIAGILLLARFDWALVVSAAGLLLLSAKIFPLLRKEEMISIILSAFFLVIVCSISIYGVAEKRYTDLRKSRVLEKVQDFNYPEDNWLQIVIPDLCQSISSDRAVASKVLMRKESAAFEIWAESSLSRLNLSCSFEVFDAAGVPFSRFSVGMPFEAYSARKDSTVPAAPVSVYSYEQETGEGRVHLYRGVSAVFDSWGRAGGSVEIVIPYFFESPELLAHTGPMAPEFLQNIERGAIAPRIDEPENLIVARMEGGRVLDTSTPLLSAGRYIAKDPDEWFRIDVGRERYNCIVRLKEDGTGFLVGFRTAGVPERLIRWATIVSLDIMLTFFSLLVSILLRRVPLLGNLMPAFSFKGGLGFRQKVLLSFLVVSILPVVILGVFSSQIIQRRFQAEGENEALARVRSAVSLIAHSIRSEAESLTGSQYLNDILRGSGRARIRDVAMFEQAQFTLIDETGRLLLDESLGDYKKEEVDLLIREAESGRVMISFEYPYVYGGVVIPTSLPDGPSGHLYYRRRMDDEFVSGIADVLGRNVNIYYGGLVRASSERELFEGGFLDPLLDPRVFAGIALYGNRASIVRESLGEYSYYVAGVPLIPLRGGERCVLSVPLLYQPVLAQNEIRRTTALILGLLAILFAATVTLGVFLAGKIFTPIAALRGGTRRIIEGDLEFRLEAEAPDEVGELVESFNTMTGALRRARRDIMERQRYLAAVLDSAATGVITTDREGRIITLNPSGERILKISLEDIAGRMPEEIDEEGLKPLLDLLGEHGEEHIREREIMLFSGGRRKAIKAVVTSLEEGRETLGTVLVFDDLTELIRSKKLAAWVEMARQIAHEVKNPLTPIKLSAQLMRKAYDESSDHFDEIFESGIETVVQQTEILRRIATEFSSFGRAASLKIEEIPLDEFMRDFLRAYRGIEGVEIRYSGAGGIRVRADREALRKIFVNLMENALQAMPEEGEVAISSRTSGGMAEISVVDTGPGLPEDIMERLFEPYFSTKTNGTGLGLTISQTLAREMDGELLLRNRKSGRGVECVVTFPLA